MGYCPLIYNIMNIFLSSDYQSIDFLIQSINDYRD